MLNNEWEQILEKIDFAFQPIVDINSGETFAFEALLRGYKDAGFLSIDEFFDIAYFQRVLYSVDLALRKKALVKFKEIYEKNKNIVLFYNLDNRIVEMEDYTTGYTESLLKELKYTNNVLTFEISEKHEFKSFIDARTIFNLYKEQGFKVALDDFGTGYSGLKMLYHLSPDVIKIDRFFITDILNDDKKKIYVANIVNIAHYSNILVVAEGVETLEELEVCNEIGCDLIQGYYVQKPTQNISKLKEGYKINSKEELKRKGFSSSFNLDDVYYRSNSYNSLIDKYIITSATNLKGEITSVSSAFCNICGYSKLELIGQPHNIVRDKTISKEFFKEVWKTIQDGKAWQGEIRNKAKDGSFYWVEATISPNFDNSGKVIGYTSVMLDITDKKKLEVYSLTDYSSGAYNKSFFDKKLKEKTNDVKSSNSYFTLAVLDLDNFKSYNDLYGHEQGDKAIKKIAQAIMKNLNKNDFLFRIGGEEFAMIFTNLDKKSSRKKLEKILTIVEDLKLEHKKNTGVSEYLTISCGAVNTKGSHIKQNTNLFVSADTLLFQAKNQGRNNLVISDKLYDSSINLIIDSRTTCYV